MTSPIGTRIAVIGNTSAGKSTLGARLAGALGVPFVELDALNWRPNWYSLAEHEPGEFTRLLTEATAGDGWVVAGSYSGFSKQVFWPRLETIIWLDLPLPLILRRVITRSWHRARTKELLWGTNYERFLPQLKVWDRDSLIWWAVTQHRRKRRDNIAAMADPRWAHIRWVRLTSMREVETFRRSIEESLSPGTHP